ncbi:MAG: polysaccharide biosynthesis tyrosine autokinase [Phycisphaerae bacterium]
MSVIKTRHQAPNVIRTAPLRPGGPAQDTAQGQQFTGRDFLRMLRKRMWLIIISVVVVTAMVSAGTVLWALYAPIYSASSLLEVPQPSSGDFQMTRQVSVPGEAMERIKKTRSRLITSKEVFDQAADQRDFKQTGYYRKNPEKIVERLYEDVSVSPVLDENHIIVSISKVAKSPGDREDLAQIVTSIANAAVQVASERANSGTRLDIERLRNQIEEQERHVERIKNRINDLVRDAKIPTLRGRVNALEIELSSLVPQKTKLEMALMQAQKELRLLQDQREKGLLATSPEILEALDVDPHLNSLKSAETNLSTELDSALEKFGPSHRRVKDIQTRLASVRSKYEARSESLTKERVQALMEMRSSTVAVLSEQRMGLEERVRLNNADLKDLQATLSLIDELMNEKDIYNKRVNRMEDMLVTLQLKMKHEQPLLLASAAEQPRERSHPKYVLMIPLGVILGLMFGLGLGFLLEFMDTSIKGPGDITRRVDMPLLGMIPHADDLDEPIGDLRLAFASHPTSLMSEAFRQVKTCVLFSGPEEGRRSILVTSPLPEDGRTTVALNLGGSLANSGKKVLVVDTNFRQPAIEKLYPQVGENGLSTALVGQVEWKDAVHEVAPNLHVMACGQMPPNPAELLGSSEMEQALAEMSEAYDQVLLDGAPALVVTDSHVLSTMVDGVILTVRAGSNTYGIVNRMKGILDRLDSHVIGVVLNGVRVTAGGYLRKNYDTFYQYHDNAIIRSK